MMKHFHTFFKSVILFLFIPLLMIGFLLGCSIKSETIYGDTPIPNLSDEQLIQEMESIYISLGQKFNKAAFLMAIMPEPAYVLTSSYTRYNMTVYTMPLGYRIQGSGITTYQYTDANAGLEAIILITQLVNQSKIRKLQDRGYAIVVEFRRRVEERRRNVEMEIEQFFIENQDLKARKPLLTAILPWIASERTFNSHAEMLEYAADVARKLRTSEKPLTTWYGTFSQIDRLRDGTTIAGSNFIKVNTQIVGNVLTGRGTLGSGEVVSLQANIKDGKWKGVVTNETYGASFQCEGTMTEIEFTASYWGSAWGKHLEGTVVLLTERKVIYSSEEKRELQLESYEKPREKVSSSYALSKNLEKIQSAWTEQDKYAFNLGRAAVLGRADAVLNKMTGQKMRSRTARERTEEVFALYKDSPEKLEGLHLMFESTYDNFLTPNQIKIVEPIISNLSVFVFDLGWAYNTGVVSAFLDKIPESPRSERNKQYPFNLYQDDSTSLEQLHWAFEWGYIDGKASLSDQKR